jgi:hypothetical protein
MIDLSKLEAVREAGMHQRSNVQRRKHNGLGLRSDTQDQTHGREKASEK